MAYKVVRFKFDIEYIGDACLTYLWERKNTKTSLTMGMHNGYQNIS